MDDRNDGSIIQLVFGLSSGRFFVGTRWGGRRYSMNRGNCKDAPHSGSAGSRGVRSGLVFEHFCKLSQVRSEWETHLLVIALSYSVAMTQLLLI